VVAQLSGARTTLEGWSIATAYVSFIMLGISLSLGPLNVIRRKHNPTHMVLRRDFGVGGGIAALVHTALGLQVHMGGVLLRYFTIPDPVPKGRVAFVAANYIGLIAAGVLAFLVMISNDVAIRRLGLARWKKAQRLAYVAAIATAAHGLLYQFQENRVFWAILFLAAASVFVFVLQVKGRHARTDGVTREKQSPAPR
jgi:sulfoxide reductase heme-binding subunit YedZ